MGLFDLVTNTVEGVASATVNTVKTVAGVAVVSLDDGETAKEGMEGVRKGVSKIGDSDSKERD